MSTLQAPDLSTSFPRSGRVKLGGYSWLARLADKARAEAAGTGGDYVAYCPLSMGFLERAGVAREAFDERIRAGASDADLVSHFDAEVPAERKAAANAFVLDEMRERLDAQDAEEGR